MLALFIWTASKAQTGCDSCILVKPQTFDFLIRQNVLAKQYQLDNIILKSQIANCNIRLTYKDSIILKKDEIIDINRQQVELINISLDQANKIIKKERKQIALLKVGIFTISAVGIVGITYFIIH